MKRLSIFVVLVFLSLSLLIGGIFISASYGAQSHATLQPKVQNVENVNYNRFNSPQMLTADNKYIYLIDRTDLNFNEHTQRYENVAFSILVVDREDGKTVTSPVHLSIPEGEDSSLEINFPLHIKLESVGTKGYIFVFYYRWFVVYSANDLVETNGNCNPIEDDDGPFIEYNTSLQTAPSYTPFFNVHYRSIEQSFMVIWGRANVYCRTHYKIYTKDSALFIENQADSSSTQTLQPFIDEESIDGIVFDSRTNDFIIAYSNSGKKARFFRHKEGQSVPTLLNYELFPHVSSVNYLASENKLVFLSQERKQITWFNPSTGEFGFVELQTEKSFSTKETDNPVFLHALSSDEVFVLDGNQSGSRKSIDQYHWGKSDESSDETLRFFRVVTATWGDDDGFYYSPSAMTVIGAGQYIVADRSGQIAITNLNSQELPQTFPKEPSGTRDGDVISMVYDNFKHVYMFDSINGIRKFDLGGTLVDTFSTDSAGRAFGNITQLIAAPDQTVFALDSLQGTDRIYRFDGTAFEEVFAKPGRAFTIASDTRGAVHDELNALILTGVSTGGKETVALSLESSIKTISSPSVSALNPGAQEIVMGLVFDIKGNALTLVQKNSQSPSRYELRQFKLEHTSTSSAFVRTSFNGEMDEATQVYAHNASLSLDKMNSRLYFIGAYHAIEYVDLQANLWTFENHTGYDHTTDKSPWSVTDEQTSNFASAKRDIPIYDYPSALFSDLPTSLNIKIEKNGVMKILEQTATFDAGKPEEAVFNYRYVMYEARNRAYYGYVRINDIDFATPKKDPEFVAGNRNRSGRVIYPNVRIYQFPTADNSAVLGHVQRNYDGLADTNIPGLQVMLVTVPDQLGRSYYEIKISPTLGQDGVQLLDPKDGFPLYHPDPNGDFVGYVSRSVVIDYRLPPSENPFVSNATVSVADGAQVYIFDESGRYVPIENEILANRTQIQVVDVGHLDEEYTYIKYVLQLGDVTVDLDGYIESRHISLNGVSWIQIISLISIIIAVITIIVLIIWRLKRGDR